MRDREGLPVADKIGSHRGFKLRLGQNHWLKSAQMDPNVIRVIERHCEEKHLAYKHMNSGADTTRWYSESISRPR